MAPVTVPLAGIRTKYQVGDRVKVNLGKVTKVIGKVTKVKVVYEIEIPDGPGESWTGGTWHENEIEPAPPTLLEASREALVALRALIAWKAQETFLPPTEQMVEAQKNLADAIVREQFPNG
jgi:hypothetical protein